MIEERIDDFDHLIYLRVFEGCNLHCEHCFIPSNPKKMTIDQIKEIRGYVQSFAKPGDKIIFQWHGGEPTAIGLRFMTEAMSIVDELKDTYRITHGIQTNLTKYNEGWRDLFMKYVGKEVGISWDPDIRYLKKNDPSSNAEFETIFWRNVSKMIEDGFEPLLIVTGTKKLFTKFKNPFLMLEYFREKGIRKIHIERITKTGNAVDNWNSLGLTHKEYSTAMSRLLKAYVSFQNRNLPLEENLFVSPLDGYIESVASMETEKPKGYGCNSGKCDTAFHTIDADGYKAGCTALTTNEQATSDNGAVQFVTFTGLRRKREERQMTCIGCPYKSVCSSGCMTSEKFDGSGECFGGKMIFEQAQNLLNRIV